MDNSLIRRFDSARQLDPQLDALLRFYEKVNQIYVDAYKAMMPIQVEMQAASSSAYTEFSRHSFLSAPAVFY